MGVAVFCGCQKNCISHSAGFFLQLKEIKKGQSKVSKNTDASKNVESEMVSERHSK